MALDQALGIIKNVVANARVQDWNDRVAVMNAMQIVEQALVTAGQRMIDEKAEIDADPGDTYHESSDNGNEGEDEAITEKRLQDNTQK